MAHTLPVHNSVYKQLFLERLFASATDNSPTYQKLFFRFIEHFAFRQ